ncbi:putative ribonuclease H-like domain-containing protein [Tanacetum coccineum]
MCDKMNKVLFTDTECLILSPDFKLPDENQILLKVPRQNNMYSFNLENIVPLGGLACLIAKATTDESNLWHRRLGHVNFKNLNRLVKGNLVRGLPTKLFQNDHTCVACQKGKQHKASCKAKLVSSISHTLQLLHMDLFGPTSIRSINHKTYCLVITDDFSRFSWTFFLRTKDETSAILKAIIRPNREPIESKGPYRAARTMLADSFLPNTFWAEAVSTACYVLNRNTIDHLGKFAGKSDEGFLVGYSLQSKAFRVYNLVTKRVEENLHIKFLENKPNVAGKGPNWLFDLDYLTDSMNYLSVSFSLKNQANIHAGQQETNQNEGSKDKIVAGDSDKEDESAQDCFEVPYWHSYSSTNTSSSKSDEKRRSPREEEQVFLDDLARLQRQEKEANEEAEALTKNLEQDTEKAVPAKNLRLSKTTLLELHKELFKHMPPILGFIVYQMDVKSAYSLMARLMKRVYVSQPPGFQDPKSPQKVYKVVKDLYGLHQAPRACSWLVLGVVRPTKRRVYVMFDNKGDAYHWSGVCQLEVMLVNALRRFRESLRRVTDGAEAFLILTLFILCLDKVSTDHAKLVPLGKVCTAKETLEKNTAKGTKCKLEPLISLTDDLSLLSNMAALESCPKHNMIAYLEKTEGNVEFHEVIDFLRRSYVYHALTVSPIVSTTFVEQFWMSAKSKTINNVRHITAKVAGKVVSISEASIRTDLNFDDADGIDSLPNQAIFNAIQRMGYEGDLSRKLANITVPLDHFPVNSLTSKVFSFMIKKGKRFSGKVTPLFDTMLVQPTQDEGASSERLSDEQPSPSPAPTSEVPNESLPDSTSAQPSEVPFEQQPDPSPSPSPRPSPQPSPTPIVPDSIPEPSGENLGDLSISGNEDAMSIQNSISRSKAQQKEETLKEKEGDSRVCIKQGRKNAKGVCSLSTEDEVSTAKEGVSTDSEKVSTDRPKLSTDDFKVSTDVQMESTDDQVDASEEIFKGAEDQKESTEDQRVSTEEQSKEDIAS